MDIREWRIELWTGLPPKLWEAALQLWKDEGKPSKRDPSKYRAFYTHKGRKSGVPAIARALTDEEWEQLLVALDQCRVVRRGKTPQGEPLARFLKNPHELVDMRTMRDRLPFPTYCDGVRSSWSAVLVSPPTKVAVRRSASKQPNLRGFTGTTHMKSVLAVLYELQHRDNSASCAAVREMLISEYGWPSASPLSFERLLKRLAQGRPDLIRAPDKGVDPPTYCLTEEGLTQAEIHLAAVYEQDTAPP